MNTPQHLLTVVAMLLVATACGASQPAYYPLAEGNRWQFGDAQHQTIAVGDTLMPDGFMYRGLLDTWYNLREYQRQQGDSVFLQGLLLYDFSRSPGDTIVHTPTYLCVLLFRDTVNALGRPLRQWVFGRSWGSFGGEIDYVTDSLGVTSILSFEPPSQKVLTGASIDGITYGVISALSRTADAIVPEQHALEQNYPNPFNPVTTIRYTVPVGTQHAVSLRVFDVLGREVATLVNDVKPAGEYQVTWDAGEQASGVYFYRLQAGAFVGTKKMMVMK